MSQANRRMQSRWELVLACLLLAGPAAAQPDRPTEEPDPAPPAERPTTFAEPSSTTDPLAEALAPRPGGLTPARVATAAMRKSHQLRVKDAEVRAAEARVEQALVAYFPRLTMMASYTRLSDTSTDIAGAVLGARAQGIPTIGACPPGLGQGSRPGESGTCLLDSTGFPVSAVPLSVTPPLNQYSAIVGLTVPVSDYFRISQAHASAKHALAAKKHEREAEARLRASDAEAIFFEWVRSKGQIVVARQAIDQALAHVEDVKVVLELGLGSRADALRLEAQLANAEKLEIETTAYAMLAEEQLRSAIQAGPDETLTIGIDVLKPPASAPLEPLEVYQNRALRNRPELRALDETIQAHKKAESVAESGYLPRLDAVGNVHVANPHPRFFPFENAWNTSWEAGATLTWTINDTVAAHGASAEATANTAAATAQRAAVRESLRLEVAAAYMEATKAAASIKASQRELEAAEEALRVRKAEFLAGRASSADLIVAETDLTRARLGKLDSHVGLLAARAWLARAVGSASKRR